MWLCVSRCGNVGDILWGSDSIWKPIKCGSSYWHHQGNPALPTTTCLTTTVRHYVPLLARGIKHFVFWYFDGIMFLHLLLITTWHRSLFLLFIYYYLRWLCRRLTVGHLSLNCWRKSENWQKIKTSTHILLYCWTPNCLFIVVMDVNILYSVFVNTYFYKALMLLWCILLNAHLPGTHMKTEVIYAVPCLLWIWRNVCAHEPHMKV